jgi:AcrR family transcriptional regulator
MNVSGQAERRQSAAKMKTESGPRARTKRIMLDSAMRLMEEGLMPSVTDVAEAAQVSRATAYRYYPTQAALVQAVVDEALGPILAWQSESTDPEQRMGELLTFAYPRMDKYEATLKAALRLALDQWARGHAGQMGEEVPMKRGHRIGLLASAIAPLRKTLGRRQFERLSQALSLIFGTEAFVVLKDIWGLDVKQAEQMALWTCHALIRSAVEEAGSSLRAPVQRARKKPGNK